MVNSIKIRKLNQEVEEGTQNGDSDSKSWDEIFLGELTEPIVAVVKATCEKHKTGT